jgi:hypothetical protein
MITLDLDAIRTRDAEQSQSWRTQAMFDRRDLLKAYDDQAAEIERLRTELGRLYAHLATQPERNPQ